MSEPLWFVFIGVVLGALLGGFYVRLVLAPQISELKRDNATLEQSLDRQKARAS